MPGMTIFHPGSVLHGIPQEARAARRVRHFYDRPSNQIYTNNRANMPLFAVPTFGVPTGTPVAYGPVHGDHPLYNVAARRTPSRAKSRKQRGGSLMFHQRRRNSHPDDAYGTSAQFPVAYSENWNLGIQYALTPSLVAEVDYIADVSRHNYLSTDINRVDGD